MDGGRGDRSMAGAGDVRWWKTMISDGGAVEGWMLGKGMEEVMAAIKIVVVGCGGVGRWC